MAPLVLYKIDASPVANAVRILADMLGLELELRDVSIIQMEHKSPEFLKLNPMGTLPILVDDGFAVSESHTIIKYLLSKFGGEWSEKLYPSELRKRARIDECLFFDTGILFIRFKVVALPSFFDGLDGPTDKHRAAIDEAYGIVEAYLQKDAYLAGDALTIADISVGATTAAMQVIHKLDETKFPRTAAWLSKLYEEPSFKKFMTVGVDTLSKMMNYCWEKNKK